MKKNEKIINLLLYDNENRDEYLKRMSSNQLRLQMNYIMNKIIFLNECMNSETLIKYFSVYNLLNERYIENLKQNVEELKEKNKCLTKKITSLSPITK